MHRLFTRQLEQATKPDGEVDVDLLGRLVVEAYAQADRDISRTDRSISLMVDELDQLNRTLEAQVADRTLALGDSEAELRAQNMRFDAAINNMSLALLMFDADGRLVIHNRRYCEMYSLAPDLGQPGCLPAGLCCATGKPRAPIPATQRSTSSASRP